MRLAKCQVTRPSRFHWGSANPGAAPLRYRVLARASATSSHVNSVKRELLEVVSRTARGVSTSPADLRLIQDAVAELRRAGEGSEITGSAQSGTWELLWTSEKETLFILERAPLFGTQAGPVYQVIDTAGGSSTSSSGGISSGGNGAAASTGGGGGFLQNVITFPPEGAFIVDSSLAVEGRQRVGFGFTAAKLKLPGGRALGLPPFGKGWFDNLFLDDEVRVSYDSRGDTLITRRAGPPRRFT